MTKLLAKCQCKRMGAEWPCAAQATEEDFLCDPCREGPCSGAMGATMETMIHVDFGDVEYNIEADGPPVAINLGELIQSETLRFTLGD